MESILNSTKALCGGIDETDTSFDVELVLFINSIFFELWQLGVGPADKVFRIEDASTNWDEFLPEDDPCFEACKTFVGCKTRLRFDPPTNTNVMEALKSTVKECEWRLNVAADKS